MIMDAKKVVYRILLTVEQFVGDRPRVTLYYPSMVLISLYSLLRNV